jgi:peptidoglycan/LPS O-acetylase OafA/YrhL
LFKSGQVTAAAGPSTGAFRPDIEGLRAIAVLLVVAFHCGVPHMSGGFIGVDVFFVLSGYLITGLLVAEVHKSGRLNLWEFYARRVRRLLPASALTLAATLLTGALILAPQELAFAGRAARAAALYISNIFFAANAADYFAPGVRSNPLLHTWSLAVEEQFYLFWPLVILVVLQLWRSTRALVAIESAITVVSLSICLWWTGHGGVVAFYQLPARAWEFGIGGMAVLVPRGSLRLPSIGWRSIGWLGAGAILGSAFFIAGDTNFPGWVALVPVLGTAAALMAGAECPQEGVGALVGLRPFQTVGKLSYSWYLWHWPLLVFSVALFPNISLGGKVAAAAASLAIAAVTHHLVENPIRFHPYLLRRPAFCIGLAAVVTGVSVTAAFVSVRFAGGLADAPGMKAITTASDDIAGMPRNLCVNLSGSTVKMCVFGDRLSATSMVLWGDSHAIQWFNPLRRIAESHGWKLTTLVKSGCPATDIAPAGNRAFAADCAAWRAGVLRKIVRQHPSIVFLGNATVYLEGHTRQSGQSGVSLEDWQRGTRRTLKTLSDAGIEVAAMRDNPIPAFDIPACLARSQRHSWQLFHASFGNESACQMEQSRVLDPAIFAAEEDGGRDLPHVHFMDLTSQFCRNGECWAQRDGQVVYRDDNHLTGKAAEQLTPILEARLVPIVNAASAPFASTAPGGAASVSTASVSAAYLNNSWASAKPYSSR